MFFHTILIVRSLPDNAQSPTTPCYQHEYGSIFASGKRKGVPLGIAVEVTFSIILVALPALVFFTMVSGAGQRG